MSSEEQAADGPEYRAKLIGPGGQIETTIAIMAASDVEAIEQVQKLALTYKVEVWDQGRMVTAVPFRGAR